MDYRPSNFDKKWQKYWAENETYKVSNDSDQPKYYVLDMFPYPSGAGLHVGHPLGYIASDILSRYKRLKGFNVLHTMGFDSFGLPAEQYAIDSGIHPAESTEKNIKYYRSQMDNIGFSYDWSREVNTSDPKYYKWTQWIFLELFNHYFDTATSKPDTIENLKSKFEKGGSSTVKAFHSNVTDFSADEWQQYSAKEQDDVLMNYRLAYRKVSYVNWCEALGTVLANDEVKDGLSERGGHPVEKKPLLQWSLRITAYAERLLNDLVGLDWTDAMKTMQANWIGRSEGAQMFFDIVDSNKKIEIFTTRPDTIFGASYMVLAPEHDYVKELTTPAQQEEVAKYVSYVGGRSDVERMADKKVTGVFLGSYALNPFNNEKVPIWIGDYVLKDYGTGAIMAVPSDDERDQAFAQKFDLPIVDVVDKSDYPNAGLNDKLGKMINSDFLNGMEVKDAIEEMLNRIENQNLGKRQINYRLRDAIFSRQRYWGEPFPITYSPEGVTQAVNFEDLPHTLPHLDNIKPTADGRSPLAGLTEWVNNSDGSTKETDTMPGYAGSSWYFLRYMDANNDEQFASESALNYWKEVDVYIGGTEHAVGHLMYSRFWHKFLFDKGLVPTVEPFKKLINQGMIQGVIEYIYLLKEKKDGQNHFMCAKLAEKRDLSVARLPIHIDFVSQYGTPNSHITMNGIKKFIDWRPEYKDAIFECSKGIYHKGIFTSIGEASDSMLLTHSEVGKMSKRYFNVVNPDDMVDRYGADCFRMYEMFLGPIEQAKPWDTKGIEGISKFLRKYWSLFFTEDGPITLEDNGASPEALKSLHKTIKKVSQDIEKYSFNTAVSSFMVCVNELKKMNCKNKSILQDLTLLLAPFAPHITEEIWSVLGNEASIHKHTYPSFDEQYLKEDSIEYPISINGKKRAMQSFPADANKETIEKAVVELEEVKKWIEGKEIKKIIVVPGRMVNIVV